MMTRRQRLVNRKNIRWKGYDYSAPGGYFVTQGTQYRKPILSRILSGKVLLTDFGSIVHQAWYSLEERFSGFVKMDPIVIMPDHIHGIIFINEIPEACIPAAPHQEFVPAALVAAVSSGPGTSSSLTRFTSSVPAALAAAAPKRPKLGDIMIHHHGRIHSRSPNSGMGAVRKKNMAADVL
jgi:hypothetical protein